MNKTTRFILPAHMALFVENFRYSLVRVEAVT